jgi:hypothetical protein
MILLLGVGDLRRAPRKVKASANAPEYLLLLSATRYQTTEQSSVNQSF